MSTPRTEMQQALVDAAVGVIDERGPEALTVRAVTDVVGCSTTGVYTHFGGKHGLVEAIYCDGFDSFDRDVCAVASVDLAESGRRYRDWALAHRTHYLIMFAKAVPDFEPGPQACARSDASFRLLVVGFERFGAPDPTAMAYHFWATVHGYVMLELVDASADPAEYRRRYDDCLTLLGSIWTPNDGR